MRDFCLVRNVREIGEMSRLYPGAVFLCPNTDAAEHCRQKGLDFFLLDEDLIRDRYRAVNQWAIEHSLRFIRRHEGDKNKAFFLDAHFYDVKSIFIRSLKYILVLEKALVREKGASIRLFGDGGSLFEIVCREYSRRDGRFKFQALPKDGTSAAVRGSWKGPVYSLAGTFLRSLPGPAKGGIFASGAIGHLAPALEALREKGHSIVYAESRFNFEKMDYCLRRGMRFQVMRESKKMDNPFEKAPLCPAGEKILFEDRVLTSVFNAAFAGLGAIGFLNAGLDAAEVRQFFRDHRPSCVVLDEDFALRRVLMLLAEEAGIKCFVVSHGVPTVTILEEGRMPPDGHYRTGLTFVNSELEKTAFASFYYDPGKIVVTGNPRYDRLSRRPSARVTARRGKTVLFPGQSTRRYDFEDHWAADLLGPRTLHLDYTRRYLSDLLEIAARQKDVWVRVKPHYEDKKTWEELVRPAKEGTCELVSSKADIFGLLAGADLVVTMPSSVICEAIMLGKPVIVLNYGQDDLSRRYEQYGVAEVVRNTEELRAAVQTYLYDDPAIGRMLERQKANFERFAGRFDSQNTQRVTRRILDELQA